MPDQSAAAISARVEAWNAAHPFAEGQPGIRPGPLWSQRTSDDGLHRVWRCIDCSAPYPGHHAGCRVGVSYDDYIAKEGRWSLSPSTDEIDYVAYCSSCGDHLDFDGESATHQSESAARRCWARRFHG